MLARRTFNRLIAAASLGLVGCGNRDDAKPASQSAAPTSRPAAMRYLALGDSYTIGESVAESQRWPVQLVAALRAERIDVADPEIIARTGWRTDDLDAGITRANPVGPYDLVTLLIGVNNQYQGRALDQYRKEFPALVSRVVRLAGAKPEHVIVLSIPDYSATPFGQSSPNPSRIGQELDKYNSIARAACEQAHVRFVDITPVSRNAASRSLNSSSSTLHATISRDARVTSTANRRPVNSACRSARFRWRASERT